MDSFREIDDNLLICAACGTQFDTSDRAQLVSCRICDDPRQFVPPSGQEFTTLGELRSSGKYKNKTSRGFNNKLVMTIWTEPKFAIGQRAFLIQTDKGNILWDLIAYIDQATVELILALGGLKAIVISHPHYYTTYAVWAHVFECPVYISSEDFRWICRYDPPRLNTITDSEIWFPDKETRYMRAIKVGGHFPGSMVLSLHPWCGMLLISDSIMTVPSAHTINRQSMTATYSFMWSIPNMIPLNTDKILRIINVLTKCEYTSTHGAFNGQDVDSVAETVQSRMMNSAKIAVGAMMQWRPEEYDERWAAIYELFAALGVGSAHVTSVFPPLDCEP